MGINGKGKDTSTVSRHEIIDRIAYVGMERGDIIISIAKSIMAAGKKVAIIDNSVSHDIFDALKDQYEEIVCRGLLTVVKNGHVDEKTRGFDLVIYYHGCSTITNIGATNLIIGISPNNQDITAVKQIKDVKVKNRHILYRDCNSSYSIKDVCHDVGVVNPKEIILLKPDIKEQQNYYRYTRDIASKLINGLKESAQVTALIIKDIMQTDNMKLVYKCMKRGDSL